MSRFCYPGTRTPVNAAVVFPLEIFRGMAAMLALLYHFRPTLKQHDA
jgi:hypothetical protein